MDGPFPSPDLFSSHLRIICILKSSLILSPIYFEVPRRKCDSKGELGRAIAQAVSRRLPTAAARVQKPGSGHVGFCDG
jgi:hypothetical protein